MRIAVVSVGFVDKAVLNAVQRGLLLSFGSEIVCDVLEENLPIPRDAYNAVRCQYHSSKMLRVIRNYAEKHDIDVVLGVTEMDLYVPFLNFVFGEAECPGRAAVISLCRLRPEFYGQSSDWELFIERVVKESVHEVGHALGLGHCSSVFCVMFFSNSILDTDRKRFFCGKCYDLVKKCLGGFRVRGC